MKLFKTASIVFLSLCLVMTCFGKGQKYNPPHSKTKYIVNTDTGNKVNSLTQALEPQRSILVPDSFDGYSQETWEELAKGIAEGKYGTEVNLDVRGWGGSGSIVQIVMEYLLQAKANGINVHMHVLGFAFSGHAYILCAAKDVTITPNSIVLFHAGASTDSYLSGVISFRNTNLPIFLAPQRAFMYQVCFDKKMINRKDMQAMDQGKEVIYVNKNGVILKMTTDVEHGTEVQNNLENLALFVFYICSVLILIGLVKRV